jgi:hypothetical protein
MYDPLCKLTLNLAQNSVIKTLQNYFVVFSSFIHHILYFVYSSGFHLTTSLLSCLNAR